MRVASDLPIAPPTACVSVRRDARRRQPRPCAGAGHFRRWEGRWLAAGPP